MWSRRPCLYFESTFILKMNLKNKANQPDEILDWVDDQDRVVGEIVRSKANSDPKYAHREVGILLVDKDERILLQKRSKYKNENPSVWSITAGHILAKGDPEITAHQELEEELGFDTKLIYLDKILKTYPWETHFTYYFLAKYDGQKIVLEPAEVEKVDFFSKAELDDLINSKEKVNTSHLPIFNKFWAGEFNDRFSLL